MYNFLLSEKYRSLRQTSLQFFFLICVLILVAIGIFLRLMPPAARMMAYNFVMSSLLSFGIYVFAAIFTASFSKDRQMLLQLSAQGHPRWRILLGQYIMSLVVALVFAVLLLLIAVIIGLLLFKQSPNEIRPLMKYLVHNTLMAFLLMIPLHAIALSLQYLMKNVAMSVAAFFVIAFFLPAGFSLAAGLNRVLDWFIRMSPFYQSMEVLMVNQSWNGNPVQLFYSLFSNAAFWLSIALVKLNHSEL